MEDINILLSSGSCPWTGVKEIIFLAKNSGYAGIELVLTRKITQEIESKKLSTNKFYFKNIKSIHQNWRFDIGLDKSYDIKFPIAILFNILRLLLFPKIKKSNVTIKFLSQSLNIPIIVHDISDRWTRDNTNKEFLGGILYEIIGTSVTPDKLKKWMRNKKHNIVIDLRDDQSLLWAKKYGYNNWQKLWQWIGLKKIKNIQLTLIGMGGLKKIIYHKKSLQEKQLLWLFKEKWKGDVTVEINPLLIFFLFKGDMGKGFKIINQFINHTLIEGKKWSI